MHTDISSLKHLSDTELVARMMRSALRERDAMTELITLLAEFDTRQIYLRDGYSSLFAYCTQVFGFSEHETFNRIAVARAARKFPIVLDLLADGSVNLTTVRLLAPHITAENHKRVLESARKKSTREVEKIVAALAPQPAVSDSIRKLPPPRSPLSPAEASPRMSAVAQPMGTTAGAQPILRRSEPAAAPPTPPAPPPPPGSIKPRAPDLYALQLSINERILEKLELARDLLRHAVPNGALAEIFERALDTLLIVLLKKKFSVTDHPRPGRDKDPDAREASGEVARAVYLRDLGRCAYVGPEGRRCGSRAFVEIHHKEVYALGGKATIDGCELRCAAHNRYEAELIFGPHKRRNGEGFVKEANAPYGASVGRDSNSFQNEFALTGSPVVDFSAPSFHRVRSVRRPRLNADDVR